MRNRKEKAPTNYKCYFRGKVGRRENKRTENTGVYGEEQENREQGIVWEKRSGVRKQENVENREQGSGEKRRGVRE